MSELLKIQHGGAKVEFEQLGDEVLKLKKMACAASGAEWLHMGLTLNNYAFKVQEGEGWELEEDYDLARNWSESKVKVTKTRTGVELLIGPGPDPYRCSSGEDDGEDLLELDGALKLQLSANRNLELRIRTEGGNIDLHQLARLGNELEDLARTILSHSLVICQSDTIQRHYGLKE